jgi:hypothetical protein
MKAEVEWLSGQTPSLISEAGTDLKRLSRVNQVDG